jgi:CHASE2 domain-containing sensor protein
MIRIGRRQTWWLIALATFALVGGLDAAGQLRPLANAAADARSRLLRHEVSSDIVIVGIDATSLQKLDRWPWPRRHHAELLKQLSVASPRRVFLDIDFSSASNDIDDAVFDSALARRRDFPVILPTFFQYASNADDHLIVSRPLPRFARSVELAGVNAAPGPDGLTRDWRNYWTLEGQRLASVIDPGRALPEEQPVAIDFSISPTSFTYVSYVDVLEGRVSRELFHDRHVYVGATALELNDLIAVPVYGSLPGIVVQALAAETVKHGPLRQVPAWGALVLLALWTALAARCCWRPWRASRSVASAPTACCWIAPRRCWSSCCCSWRPWCDRSRSRPGARFPMRSACDAVMPC